MSKRPTAAWAMHLGKLFAKAHTDKRFLEENKDPDALLRTLEKYYSHITGTMDYFVEFRTCAEKEIQKIAKVVNSKEEFVNMTKELMLLIGTAKQKCRQSINKSKKMRSHRYEMLAVINMLESSEKIINSLTREEI